MSLGHLIARATTPPTEQLPVAVEPRRLARVQFGDWHPSWKRPGFRFPARLLWRIGIDEPTHNESGERATVALGTGHTDGLLGLNDALRREGHPYAGVVDWSNVPRAMVLHNHVERWLRSSPGVERVTRRMYRLNSDALPFRALATLYHDPRTTGQASFWEAMSRQGFSHREVGDAIQRIAYLKPHGDWDNLHERWDDPIAPTPFAWDERAGDYVRLPTNRTFERAAADATSPYHVQPHFRFATPPDREPGPTRRRRSGRPRRFGRAEHEAFHRVIVANPNDTTAHLAYADYLEENGKPHVAEAIRRAAETGRAYYNPGFNWYTTPEGHAAHSHYHDFELTINPYGSGNAGAIEYEFTAADPTDRNRLSAGLIAEGIPRFAGITHQSERRPLRRSGRPARLARLLDLHEYQPLVLEAHQRRRAVVDHPSGGRDEDYLPASHLALGVLADRLDDEADPRTEIVRAEMHFHNPETWRGVAHGDVLGRRLGITNFNLARQHYGFPNDNEREFRLHDGSRLFVENAVHSPEWREPVVRLRWAVPTGLSVVNSEYWMEGNHYFRDALRIARALHPGAARAVVAVARRATEPFRGEPRPRPDPRRRMSRPAYTLGPGSDGRHMSGARMVRHDILDPTGRAVGRVHLIPRGDELHVDWAGMHGAAAGERPEAAVGVGGVAALRGQLAAAYPEARWLTGRRVKRAGTFAQAVRLPLRRLRRTGRPKRYSFITEADFHRAMCTEPRRGHHLIYADWLDEHDMPATADLVRNHGSGYSVQNPSIIINDSSPGGVAHGDRPVIRTFRDGPKMLQYLWMPDASKPGRWLRFYRGLPGQGPVDVQRAYASMEAIQDEHTGGGREGVHVRMARPQHDDFLGALRRLKSRQQQALRGVAKEIAGSLKLDPVKTRDALHDAPGGATGSVAQAVYGGHDPDTVRYAAAWYGLLTRTPGMAVLHVAPDGPDSVYRLRMRGSGEDIRKKLDRHGITSRVLMPTADGFDVVLLDPARRARKLVGQFARSNGVVAEESRGRAELVGGPDPASAREKYRQAIAGYESQPERFARRGLDPLPAGQESPDAAYNTEFRRQAAEAHAKLPPDAQAANRQHLDEFNRFDLMGAVRNVARKYRVEPDELAAHALANSPLRRGYDPSQGSLIGRLLADLPILARKLAGPGREVRATDLTAADPDRRFEPAEGERATRPDLPTRADATEARRARQFYEAVRAAGPSGLTLAAFRVNRDGRTLAAVKDIAARLVQSGRLATVPYPRPSGGAATVAYVLPEHAAAAPKTDPMLDRRAKARELFEQGVSHNRVMKLTGISTREGRRVRSDIRAERDPGYVPALARRIADFVAASGRPVNPTLVYQSRGFSGESIDVIRAALEHAAARGLLRRVEPAKRVGRPAPTYAKLARGTAWRR